MPAAMQGAQSRYTSNLTLPRQASEGLVNLWGFPEFASSSIPGVSDYSTGPQSSLVRLEVRLDLKFMLFTLGTLFQIMISFVSVP